MNTYFNRLIAVMILCQITTVITPDSERAKQSIRMLCALLSLLTLLSPLRNLTDLSDRLTEYLTAVFEPSSIAADMEKESDSIHFLQYITEYYNIDDVSMVVHTDETDTRVLELELYIKNYPYAACSAMEKELQELLNIPVYVFGK